MAIETKVTASSIGSFAAGLGVAVLNETLGNSAVMGTWPAWLQFVLIAFGPALITFLSGFTKKSSTSSVSDGYSRAA